MKGKITGEEKRFLFYSAAAKPVLCIVLFVEATDNNSFAGTCMNKLPVFEVDTHVVEGSFLPLGEVEKDKITRFQTAFPDALAVFIIDINNRAL